MNNEKIQDMVLKLIESVNLLLQTQLTSGEIQHQEDSEDTSNLSRKKLYLAEVMLDQLNMKTELQEMQDRLRQVESKIEEMLNSNANKID